MISTTPSSSTGGTGLGKTHLMQAIGHAALKRNPDIRIYYAPSEKFMNEMIQAITAGTDPGLPAEVP